MWAIQARVYSAAIPVPIASAIASSVTYQNMCVFQPIAIHCSSLTSRAAVVMKVQRIVLGAIAKPADHALRIWARIRRGVI